MKLPISDLNNRHKTGLFLTAIAAGLCLFFEDSLRQTLGVILIALAFTWAFGSANRALRLVVAALGILMMLGPLAAALIDHRNAMRTYEESVSDFEKQLPEFAREHPDLSTGLPPLPTGAAIDLRSLGATAPVSPTIPGLPPGAIIKPMPMQPPPADPYAAYGGKTATGAALEQSFRLITIPDVGNVAFPQQMSSKKIAEALKGDTKRSKPPDWYYKALEAGIDPVAINDLPTPRDHPPDFSLSGTIADGYFVEIPGLLLTILFIGSVLSDKRVAHK